MLVGEEKDLHRSVVPVTAFTRHAAACLVGRQQLPAGGTRELAPLVPMHQTSIEFDLTVAEGPLVSLKNQRDLHGGAMAQSAT